MPQPPSADSTPWHRQLWPWLLMLGPGLVLIAGAYTFWLAWSTDDGLVARDYYKRGLLINRTLQRDHNAAALHLTARGNWNADGNSFTVHIEGGGQAPRDPVLQVVGGKAGIQTSLPLKPIGGGWYEAALPRPDGPGWRFVLETEDWRLTTTTPSVPGAPLQFVATDP